ncbi:hypothetical protein CI109_101536 [Kwoniella shandongensis]|uniref:Uncharacterized protein n=1 Tax=Kwoniella shandongensis TaxID=1734106 RepID=A0A5M6C5X8_9TREE|nr:uncharacterized protein CI109_001332 [Kwoniella shandongensis]KAA5530528.1 hypothetical protein CI109_001332 [Kwoniella shandongensis]
MVSDASPSNDNVSKSPRIHIAERNTRSVKREQPPAVLERQSSRLSNILTHVRSNEVYPPEWQNDLDEDGITSNVDDVERVIDKRPTPDGNRDEKDISGSRQVEKAGVGLPIVVDIEHTPVDDDPREWGDRKKWFVLTLITFALLGPTMAASIYNPVINEIREELHGTSTQIGLTLSLYILFQGFTPVFWAALSEVNGRKTSYLISYAIYLAALIVASRANSMPLLIVMRILQATGSGAVNSAGAGSLADMYESHERGAKLGIYYSVPMFGPGIGPIIGGALGQSFGWRSVFYFSAALGGVMEILFIFFPDSWRKERSRTYQNAVAKAAKRAQQKLEQKRTKEAARLAKADKHTPSTSTERPVEIAASSIPPLTDVTVDRDVEEGHHSNLTNKGTVHVKKRWYLPFGKKKVVETNVEEKFKITPGDLNPFPLMIGVIVMRRPTNALVIMSSGICFSAQYTIVYTASITLGDAPYSYNSLNIGLVILAFGIGNICASIIGGRYSDVVLKRQKKQNGGVGVPEMRLKSTFIAMPFIILSFLAYAWTAHEKVHIAGIVVSLFCAGFSLMWIYSPTLAYLVDSNPGLSAPASSCASFVRGALACVMSQIAVPIRNGIGDGGMYSLFAGLVGVSCGLIVLLYFKGESLRIRALERAADRAKH